MGTLKMTGNQELHILKCTRRNLEMQQERGTSGLARPIKSLKNKQNNHGLHSCIHIRGIHKLGPGLASKHKHSPKGWWDCRGKHLAMEKEEGVLVGAILTRGQLLSAGMHTLFSSVALLPCSPCSMKEPCLPCLPVPGLLSLGPAQPAHGLFGSNVSPRFEGHLRSLSYKGSGRQSVG